MVYRFLGSPQSLDEGFARLRELGKPLVVLGGEQTPDAALMELSTVPIGVAAQAHVYLAQGGPVNLTQLHAFLSDTVLLTGVGFEPPAEQAVWGELPRPLPAARADGAVRPRVGILFYRAQQAAGNTAYVHRAGRRDRRRRRAGCADLRHLAAGRTRGAARPPRQPGRPDHHRAGRRWHPTGHRLGR